MRTLLAAITLSCALCIRLSGAPASLAVPFFELEELKVSNAIAVGRFASLIDQRSLYAVRLSDGVVLVRIDDVGPAPFDVSGTRLVFADARRGRVIDMDLTASRREELWMIPAGTRVLAIQAVQRVVRLLVEDADGIHAVQSGEGTRWRPIDIPDTLQAPDPSRTQDVVRSSEYAVWPERRDGRLFLTSSAIVSGAPPPSTAPAIDGTARVHLDVAAERSVGWLERQLSKPFVSRHGRPARLIDSYEDAQRAGWIYDASLAAITFSAAGELGIATELLAGLEHLQQADGSWVASFDPDSASPRGSDRYVGAMAWVVMAANFFQWETRDDRFASMARRGLSYLAQHRVTDVKSEWHGALRMGPSRPVAISIEHNVDAYSAFLWRGRLERDPHDLAIADGIRAFVLRQLWVEPGGSAAPDGHFSVGAPAGGLFLDAQTWTTLAFGDGPPDARLEQALRSAERRLRVDSGRLGPVHDIIGLDESDTAGREKIWAEGTEGMVTALFVVGDGQRARRYHSETARYQGASGGIPYATENRSGWTTSPAVAATGWYILNSLVPFRNPFNPERARRAGALAPASGVR
jgi:hypothetical protein